MKSWSKWLGLALSLAVIGSLQAADQHVGQVDLKKIFDGYYKTKSADTSLKAQASDSEKILKGMVDDYQKAREDYKKLVDGVNDPAITTDEKDKRKKNAETKILELQEIERSVQQYRVNTQTVLDERKKRMREDILKQIRDVINDRAKKAGYTLVVDSAAETINQTPVVLYNSGVNDFTDEVLTEINKDAPSEAKVEADVKPLPAELNKPTKK